MNASVRYRHYSDVVKSEIARTKNIYLFPDLKIPRTTAQYWVKTQGSAKANNIVEFESAYKRKSEFLASELAKEKAMRVLLETVRKVFPFDFRLKQLKSKIARAQIVAGIQECNKHHKLTHCLDAIGLTKGTYRRWASEVSLCSRIKSPCERRKASQLTEIEVATMRRFVTSKKYAHISVSSLHLLAQRTGELFCSVDTWYKYIRSFEWRRPWKKKKHEIKKIGIRATRPNEIWHIDVTVVNVGPNFKLYIQAVIDNFSRFVLAWRVTDEINAKSTVDTIELARKKASALLDTEANSNATDVMMDPGTENRNDHVLTFITSKNLRRVLAQVDVRFSNSMVEGLFHGFKTKFLNHQKVKTPEDLLRKANFYFRQHNEIVPLAVHRGGKPIEIYKCQWGTAENTKLQENKQLAMLARRKKNQEPPCSNCPALI